jgi:chromosomal replication initiation ATPase DnaA
MIVNDQTIQRFIELSTEMSKIAKQLGERGAANSKADVIVAAIKSYYPFDILQKTRKSPIPEARFVAFYLMRKYSQLSLREIAYKFGNNKHDFVIHGSDKAKELLEIRDEKITREVTELSEIIERDLKLYQSELKANGATQGTMLRVVDGDNKKEKVA